MKSFLKLNLIGECIRKKKKIIKHHNILLNWKVIGLCAVVHRTVGLFYDSINTFFICTITGLWIQEYDSIYQTLQQKLNFFPF